MGTDFSDLSPRGDEEKKDLFSTENRHGVVEPDRGDETIFNNKFLDWWLAIDTIYWVFALFVFIPFVIISILTK